MYSHSEEEKKGFRNGSLLSSKHAYKQCVHLAMNMMKSIEFIPFNISIIINTKMNVIPFFGSETGFKTLILFFESWEGNPLFRVRNQRP